MDLRSLDYEAKDKKAYHYIQEAFDEVIKYSQNISECNSDELFKQWFANKEEYIEAFNGELIYTIPNVQFPLDAESKKHKLALLVEEIGSTNYNLGSFIWEQKEGFFSNQVSSQYSCTYEGKNKILKPGIKLLKAFKYFEPDKTLLHQYQDMASRLIQEDKIEGDLCISVHPLDYLSVSENDANWRSCHALDGEYRAGNLNYMADDTTVICYLKAKEDRVLPNFPSSIRWNSKKWRVLLFFSNDHRMIFAGKPYPASLDEGMNFILNELLPQARLIPSNTARNSWTPWSDECFKEIRFKQIDLGTRLTKPHYLLNGELVPITELIKDCDNNLFFNDLLKSSCYIPKYTFQYNVFFDRKEIATNWKITRFHIGKSVKCLRCNQQPITIPMSMYCDDCELKYGNCDDDEWFTYCDQCGKKMFIEEGFSVNDDQTYCSKCAELYTTQCSICGLWYSNQEMTEVVDDNTSITLCPWCKKEKD